MRLSIVAVFLWTTAFADSPPRIAVIIDDIGYNFELGQRATELPGPIACAVLPDAPRARTLAEAAYHNGKEVLLHLPLQSVHHDGVDEPSSLVLDMSRGQFRAAFQENLAGVPYVVGVNTHRGSLLTRHPGHMRWLMEELVATGGLFFVDSFTTHASVAIDVAREAGVPSLRRDVFLDFEQSEEAVRREFARLIDIAERRGSAVGIGHPYSITLDLLERELPALESYGIELVAVSRLVAEPQSGLKSARLRNPLSAAESKQPTN